MEPQGGWACAEGHALRWSAAQQTKSRTRAENTVLRKDGGMGVYASKTNKQTEWQSTHWWCSETHQDRRSGSQQEGNGAKTSETGRGERNLVCTNSWLGGGGVLLGVEGTLTHTTLATGAGTRRAHPKCSTRAHTTARAVFSNTPGLRLKDFW